MTQTLVCTLSPPVVVRGTVLIDPTGVVRSVGANFLSVARDPKDVLITARAFASGWRVHFLNEDD